MNVYVCNDHDGMWPVPVASVVLADNEDEARRLLDAELIRQHLKPYAEYPYTLREFDNGPAVEMLSNGDY